MNPTPKHHLAQQLLADEDRILDLTLRLAAGDESARREIEVLENTIQVKIALISGMKEEDYL